MPATLDRAPDVLVDEQIGRTRYLTPEGYLYCEAARIARIGPMLYRHDEVPDIEPAGPGMITVTRDADVLFAPETLASFVGKPVTNDHPPSFVDPKTFKAYSVGVVLNPRRGEGVEADYLLADLLITDAVAIADVMENKKELSLGYSAPREQVRPGFARQTDIIGNHVALVARGRGGPACAIQDQQPDPPAPCGEPDMATKKRSVWDRLTTAFKANDEAAFNEELEAAKDESGADEPQRVVIELKHPEAEPAKADEPKTDDESVDPLAEIKAMLGDIAARIAKFESGKAAESTTDEDSEEPKDDEETSDDDGEMEPVTMDAFSEARSRAEILAPGISLPTFDAKADPKAARQTLRDLHVRALTAAHTDPRRKAHVDAVLSGRKAEFSKMTADHLATVFVAASELAKAAHRPASRLGAMPQGPMTTAKYAELIKSKQTRA